MEKFNAQIPIRYGVIAFAAAITIGLLMYVFYQSLASGFLMFAAIGVLSLALILFLGIWSGISYRRSTGGVISFEHAFLAVFIVFVLNSVGSMTSQILVNKVIDPQYAEKLSSLIKEKMTDKFEQMNMTDEQIKEATKEMTPEKFNPPMAKQLQSFGIYLVIAAVVAALIAAFIKRGSSDLINTGATMPTKGSIPIT